MNTLTKDKRLKYNIYSGLIFQLISLIIGFIVRKQLVEYVGIYFLGIDGVFSNVIALLNLLDFGIGTASMFYMFKTFASDDMEEFKKVYNTFQLMYRIIAAFISIIGLVVLLNLNMILDSNSGNLITVKIIFAIQIVKLVSNFLLICPRMALQCDEKLYYNYSLDSIGMLFFGIIKVITLVKYESYILYLIISLFELILPNLFLRYILKKEYGNINSIKYVSFDKVVDIFNYAKKIVILNINSFIFGSTDNLIITKYLGITSVGLMSNYYVLVGIVTTFSMQIFHSVSSSMINYINRDFSNENMLTKKMYNVVHVIVFCVASFCALCLVGLTDNFISLFFGKEYVLGDSIIILMSISLIFSLFKVPSTFIITSCGYTRYESKFAIFASLVNLILSIYLVQSIGLSGVLIGTAIASLILLLGNDSIVIKRRTKNLKEIFCKRSIYLFIIAIQITILKFFLPNKCETFFEWFGNGLICVAIWIFGILIISKTEDFKNAFSYIKDLFKKKKGDA